MKKFVVGIRHKNSGIISAWSIVDDCRSWFDAVRADVAKKDCAYAMFPENYEFVYKEINSDEIVFDWVPFAVSTGK